VVGPLSFLELTAEKLKATLNEYVARVAGITLLAAIGFAVLALVVQWRVFAKSWRREVTRI
jgi:hypothetical protein